MGLSRLKGVRAECVFSCELDPELRELYESNFGDACAGDITCIDESDVPPHDILCAGFPCQPFSKAGEQKGLQCAKNGDLFEDHLLRIVRRRLPALLLLENVPNLERHNNRRTWERMQSLLEDLGYQVECKILSPHRFAMPQIRERMYIVAARTVGGLVNYSWPRESSKPSSIYDILEDNPEGARPLPAHYVAAMEIWNEFLKRFPRQQELPSFPIWAMEFGANYPACDEEGFPGLLTERQLLRYRGSFGSTLAEIPSGQRLMSLPSYSQEKVYPRWKQTFIRQNRELYHENRSWIDSWKTQLRDFAPSLQKFEWNCKGARRDIWQHIIQFRASGIRVRRANAAPALVAMTTTQVPVIASAKRYMTVKECASLQRLEVLASLPRSQSRSFKALGNAVNSEMVRLIASQLLKATSWRQRAPLSRRQLSVS